MATKIYLYESDKPAKKYYIEFTNPKTGRVKKTYFGATGYEDYTMHKDDKRKDLYLARHKAKEDYTNIYLPGALSKFLLWNKKTLPASIKDANTKFGVKIIKKI
jgi:hypothetical protein